MPDPTTSSPWTPTRLGGLEILENFLPHAARDYAEMRNHDLGPADRSNVSTLSPYLRHRLVLEEEVVDRVLRRHGYQPAAKFIQEVCWRTYWKGWLELRPSVWTSYRAEVRTLVDRLDHDSTLRDAYEAATEGRTGIACFDAWGKELVEVGYLHNHARMWFASLWIFTLKLPWALGADFFIRHLMDGDPASNTLSWRWVAGLQTRGKIYLATSENIAKYTNGRFRPTERFAQHGEALPGGNSPPIRPLAPAGRPADRSSALLVLEADLAPETLGLNPELVGAVVGFSTCNGRSLFPVGQPCRAFADGALDDALARASTAFEAPADRLDSPSNESIIDHLRSRSLEQLITPDIPTGPASERLGALAPMLDKAGIRLVRVRRPWDDTLWPNATAGYFPFKEKLEPALLRMGMIKR